MITCLDNLLEYEKKSYECKTNFEKKELIEEYSSLRKLWMYIYDPFLKMNFNQDAYMQSCRDYRPRIDNIDVNNLTNMNLYESFDKMIYSNHDCEKLANIINTWVKLLPDYEKILFRIIKKTFYCNITVDDIHMVYPGLIGKINYYTVDEFDYTFKRSFNKQSYRFNRLKYYITPVFMGLRAYIMYRHGNLFIVDYNGNILLKLERLIDELKEHIKKYKLNDFVIEGYIVVPGFRDETRLSLFLRNYFVDETRKHPLVEDFCFYFYDFLYTYEFDEGETEVYYKARLKRAIKYKLNKLTYLRIVRTYQYNRLNYYLYKRSGYELGWLGFLLIRNCGYKAVRGSRRIFIPIDYEMKYFPDQLKKSKEYFKWLKKLHQMG